MPARVLDIGFSTCPNDTFMFHGLIRGGIEVPGIEFRPVIEDIEALNLRALGDHPLAITKLSASALARACDRYTVLASGAALGRGCGPLVVCRSGEGPTSLAELSGKRVAIPGIHTTAYLLLRALFRDRAGPEVSFEVVVLRFDEIMDAVAAGRVDAGLVIHESRFTYADHGLTQLCDLGVAWEEQTGLPIPLGMICARRDLPPSTIDAVEAGLRRSVEQAFADPAVPRPWIRELAQEIDEEVCRRHIELYVNDFSLDLGEEGREAIDVLLCLGRDAGLVPAGRDPWRRGGEHVV